MLYIKFGTILFDQLSPVKAALHRGHIKASGKLGLCRVVSFGIHLSLHIEPGRVDGVTTTHIGKQQLSSDPQSHDNIRTPVDTL